MPWLQRNGQRLAATTIASTAKQRRRGLLGIAPQELSAQPWALLIPRCRSVHTIGMRFAIDVIYRDRDDHVLDIATMRPGRIGRPRLRARSVIETASGQCETWALAPGDPLSVVE